MMKNQIKLHGENVIPAGYKRTEVGVIPDDWDEINLNSIVSGLEAGVSVNSIDQIDAYSHGKHILKTSCVSNGHFYGYEKKSILPTDVKRAKCSPVKGGIIVSRMNTPALVGEVGYVAESNLDSFLPDRLWQMKFKKDVAHNPKWLATLLSFPPFSKKIKETATGTSGSMKNISKNAFLSLKLPWPTLKEQNTIGTALSDADALITALEQLITKKKAIKTATMQQLLTARTRLPQFAKHPDGTVKGYKSGELGHIPEDWEEREIGNFAPLQRGFDLPASKRSEGLYPVVYSNGIVNTHNHFQVKGPGVVTGRSGTLGKVHHIECDFWPHNTSLWVTKFINSDSKFVYYIFKYIGFERFASGSGVPTLNRNDAHSFKVAIPSSLKEQTTIATILSDMDAELTVLEKKLSKIRDIKQGMMQQLLTGRIRLPLDNQP